VNDDGDQPCVVDVLRDDTGGELLFARLGIVEEPATGPARLPAMSMEIGNCSARFIGLSRRATRLAV
jgi:hypothetical protein